MANKVFSSAKAALADIVQDGQTLAVAVSVCAGFQKH